MTEKMQQMLPQIEYMLSLMGKCTDNYVFMLDFERDYYVISETAVDVFRLSEAQFFNATDVFKEVMHPRDYPLVIQNLTDIREGRTTSHNLEYRWYDKEGNIVWISCRGEAIADENGKVCYLIGRIAEIDKQNKIDSVTSLYNEYILQKKYKELTAQKTISGFMMLIGIDNFKEINEKYGRNFGNKVLKNLAGIIVSRVEPHQEVYRMDGDGILICDFNGSGDDAARNLYQKIRIALEESITENGFHMFHTISAGAVYFTSNNEAYIRLLEKLNFVLHSAKLNGKNNFALYEQEDYENYIRKLHIQECLRRSVENNFEGFELYYQPIIDVKRDCVGGAEALLRWTSEEYGFMSPAEFIPLLEESSLIIPLGRWIMQTAINQCVKWQQSISDFKVNINLSFVQLQKSNIMLDTFGCIEESGIDARHIVFELTESGEMESGQKMQNTLQKFRDCKIGLAIDDFGTGYSNLRYIKDKMFDMLKIDREFIRHIKDNEYDYMLVKHVTELAHCMNMLVCYEGVETEEELETAKQLSPDYIQGYYYGKPVSAKEFEEKYL